MTRTRSLSHGHSQSHSIAPQTPPRARSPSPEATALGVTRYHALLDTPSPGHISPPLPPRQVKQPERYGENPPSYGHVRACSRSVASGRSRSQTRGSRHRATSSGAFRSTSRSRSRGPARPNDAVELIGIGHPKASQIQNGVSNAGAYTGRAERRARITQSSQPRRGRPATRRQRGRSRVSREQDRSPTPGTSDIDAEALESLQLIPSKSPARLQSPYEYDEVNRSDFVGFLAVKLGRDPKELQEIGTADLVAMLRLYAEADPAKVGTSKRAPEVFLLPPSAKDQLDGMKWQNPKMRQQQRRMRLHPSELLPPVNGKRRSLDNPDESAGSSKRMRPSDNTATDSESDDPPSPTTRPPDNNTDTELESDDNNPPRPPAPPVASIGSQAPPPTREGTPTTNLDTPELFVEQSVLRGDSPSILPPGIALTHALPILNIRLQNPTHAHLRQKSARRFQGDVQELAWLETERLRQEMEQERVKQAGGSGNDNMGGVDGQGQRSSEERGEGDVEGLCEVVDELVEGLMDEFADGVSHSAGAPRRYPKTPAPKRTYGHTRSHATASDEPTQEAAPPERPNSPSTAQDVLFAVEATRERLERLEREEREMAAWERDSRAVLPEPHSAVQPVPSPVTRAQAGSNSNFVRPCPQLNRRQDPISAARNDVVNFNNEVARGNATSIIESAIRPNLLPDEQELAAQCGRMRDRSGNGLLQDDEEDLARAQALAQGTVPKPARRRRRNRKKKPLARDFTGVRRQVLILAKLHLFAYALVEGIYQTRTTYIQWAQMIHERTWSLLAPDQPYEAASDAELEILVNYIATLRGKTKERARPVTANIHELNHRIQSQQDIQRNIDIFREVHPNSFHCASTNPRHGHYESPHLGHFIGACLGHGPTSVVVQFPQYFGPLMPITVVAFILALWQFSLEEWTSGFHQPRELGTAHMLNKYEAHLAGLKNLRDVAPRRFQRLQHEWAKYVSEYSGASFIRTHQTNEVITNRSEMRPDSPVQEPTQQPTQIEHRMDESEEQTMAEACASGLTELRGHARDVHQFLDDPEDNADAPTSHTVRSRFPSPTPAPEYDENGRLTARSKGKRRAN